MTETTKCCGTCLHWDIENLPVGPRTIFYSARRCQRLKPYDTETGKPITTLLFPQAHLCPCWEERA
jgi:hypothetical protein